MSPDGRLAALRSSKILQGSAWILIGLGVQSGLGFVFWFLGSKVASVDEVGRASGLFTAIQFVNYASGLGLTVALARHATDESRESGSIVGWASVATVVSSVVGGAIYLSLVASSDTDLVRGSVAGWLLFCAYTAGTSIGLLADVRLMAARRWGWLVGRIALVGLIRLPLVLLDVDVDPGAWLFHLMLAPLALGGVVALFLLPRAGAGRPSLRRPAALGTVARYSGVNWVATLASQGPQFVLPLLVAASVTSADYATFFLAWLVTGLVFLVPGAISQVLLVEGSKDASQAAGTGAADHVPAPDRAREALLFSLVLSVSAWLASLLAGPVVDVVFGDAYDDLARTLPALMAAGIPWAFASVRLSQARIRRDQFATVAITLTLGVGILAPALLWIPDHGVAGATRAWLLGNTAAAIVAVVLHQRSRRPVPRLAAASG